MTKSRQSANLVSRNNIFSDVTNSRVGIGTTLPTGKLQITSGPVIVGSGNSTGTESQPLQVSGGFYVSGNVGINHTNPSSRLDVVGDGNFTGVVTAGRFGSPVLVGSSSSTGTASQNLQVTGSAYISGNLGIGTTNPTTSLQVSGSISGTAFESYELDDLSTTFDGQKNTFTPTFNYETVTITNPFGLMITINGIPQSAFINNTDCVYQSNFLGSNNGFTIDTDNNIKFTESIPTGSDIVVRVLPVSNTPTKIKYYPFKPADILLGY